MLQKYAFSDDSSLRNTILHRGGEIFEYCGILMVFFFFFNGLLFYRVNNFRHGLKTMAAGFHSNIELLYQKCCAYVCNVEIVVESKKTTIPSSKLAAYTCERRG